MNSEQIIKVDGIEYLVEDSLINYRIEDSFIDRSNKLAQFSGNGEAKKHIGSYAGDGRNNLGKFFNYYSWGLEYIDPETNSKTMNQASKVGAVVQHYSCCFSKSNLLHYLADAKSEYFSQEQEYHNNIGAFFDSRHSKVSNLDSEYIWFSIYDASDNRSKPQSRAYIRSDDNIWNLWRTIVLPKISYLSILKLKPVDSLINRTIFYFQIQLDFQYRSFTHPSLLKKVEASRPLQNVERRLARLGADKYRREVLDLMGRCPFTLINDERLLIASHIKPYAVCVDEGRFDHAVSPQNGLALSPTYDKLFDQGFLTFTDFGELICSPLLSPFIWSKLNINPSIKKRLQIFPEGRKEFLEFHRSNVFQGSVEEILG